MGVSRQTLQTDWLLWHLFPVRHDAAVRSIQSGKKIAFRECPLDGSLWSLMQGICHPPRGLGDLAKNITISFPILKKKEVYSSLMLLTLLSFLRVAIGKQRLVPWYKWAC